MELKPGFETTRGKNEGQGRGRVREHKRKGWGEVIRSGNRDWGLYSKKNLVCEQSWTKHDKRVSLKIGRSSNERRNAAGPRMCT